MMPGRCWVSAADDNARVGYRRSTLGGAASDLVRLASCCLRLAAVVAVSPATGARPEDLRERTDLVVAADDEAAITDKAAQQLARATKHAPWENGLGMRFVPIPTSGRSAAAEQVLFSIWETRVQDFGQFIRESGYDMKAGEPCATIESDRSGGWRAKRAGGDWQNPRFGPAAKQTGSHPVVCVSWADANAFCRWLTRREQKGGRLAAGWTYRLPTDHEWSCAVGICERESAGASPEQKNWKIKGVYPWGTQWPPRQGGAGNYAGIESHVGVTAGKSWVSIEGYRDAWPRTAPVGRTDANTFGLFDVGGNVREWCSDAYNPSGQWRVARGGSWHYGEPAYLLASHRDVGKPKERQAYSGFRIVVAGATSRD